jgi:septum formation protein
MTQITANGIFREPLFLASSSPRRAEILRTVGWPFEAVNGAVDETRHADEGAVEYVRRLGRAKAAAAASGLSSGLVLGADTVVVVKGEILGQPRDDDDARRMLNLLRGRWHEVLTGVALVRAGQEDQCVVDHEVTRVLFTAMSEKQIEWYVSTREPLGKAGAYAIQGRAALFIAEIQGDYFNIVGLPVRRVYELAREIL